MSSTFSSPRDPSGGTHSLGGWLFQDGDSTPEESSSIEQERRAFNTRRARVLLPFILGSLIALGLLFFRFVEAHGEAQEIWFFYTNILNLITVLVQVLVLALVFRSRRAPEAVEVLVVWLLLWGGIASGNVQRTRATIDLFLFCNLGVVFAFRPALRLLFAAQGVSWLILAAGIVALQGDPTFRRNELLLSLSITTLAFAVGRANFIALGSEVKNRLLIERQRRELESLNASLEERVQAQVGEIVAHSREIEQLNAELRQQVKERSRELSQALARIVRQHGARGALDEGSVLAERFVIGKVLGRGGMGAVYSAIDQVTKEQVAIKVIEASSAHELDANYRFLQEAHASARVNHPAVVYARHVDIADGLLFLVFAFIPGEPLHLYFRDHRPLASSKVARLGALIADVLAAAHAVGVVHRDIKPANILVTGDISAIHLLDFGISKLREAPLSDSSETREGAILGTPAYMAPEQASGAVRAAEPSDIYSLGVVLYELLSGRLPFENSNLRAVMVAHVLHTPPPLRSLRPGVPEPLASLVHRCLEKNPSDRPSATEVAATLRVLEPTLPQSPEPLSPGAPPAALLPLVVDLAGEPTKSELAREAVRDLVEGALDDA